MGPFYPGLMGIIVSTGQLDWTDLLVIPTFLLLCLTGLALLPELFAPPMLWLVTHTIYRLKVVDRNKIPATGPALIVCNHVSYVDWLFLWAACPRRPRFVGWSGFAKHRLLRWVFRITRTIPIDIHAGPKQIVRSMNAVTTALDAGELVCIFPEATITRTGGMLPFHRGIERILKNAKGEVPIFPVYLNQVWGSIFSYRGGKLFRKWPQQIPYPVSVSFGNPLPKSTPAAEVRRILQELSADVAIRERASLLPPHRTFVRVACRIRQLNKSCFIDTSTPTPRTLNYAKTLVAGICLAKWLKPRIGTEQNVGVWLPSSLGSALANMALSFLGRTSVNLNYTAGADSNQSATRQTGLKVILTSRKFLDKIPLPLDESITRIYLEDGTAGITKWQRTSTFLKVLLLPGWFIDRFVLGIHEHSIDSIATIIFSSGSTGEPKGVMLSHGNIASNANAFIQRADFRPEDRVLAILPTFHSFGYTVTLWAPLMGGFSTVYYPDPRQAKEIGELCRVHRCTLMIATATFLRLYLRRTEAADFATLRLLVCGAEKLPVSLAIEFEKKFGILPLEGYGCTELSPVVSVNLPDIEIGGVKQQNNRIGTIGQPIPGVAARIADPESELPLGLNVEGMLLIKGPNVMAGYLDKPEMTAKAIRNGWYVTGDMGKIDDDGFISITGRISRFAKIAGEMVPLEKLEEEMLAILGGGDRTLAVTAIPDEKRGERLMVLHLATMPMAKKELLDKLGSRGMPNLWIPSEREFYPIPEMPILGTGKLDLKKLKEVALELGKKT